MNDRPDIAGSAVVRFRDPSGQVAGHGALVDAEHVVTCAHVINAVLGRELTEEAAPLGTTVRLEFPVGARFVDAPPTRSARVTAWAAPGGTFDGVDVAGLTLFDEPPPAGVRPMPIGDRTPSAGDVLLYGTGENRPGAGYALGCGRRPLCTGNKSNRTRRAFSSPALGSAAHPWSTS
ncbi:hypothetical protein GCM10029964_089010 [Kibdelosporangium lantanae]